MALSGAAMLGLVLAPVKLCLFAVLFHVPCPGCGMTRATLALLRGDFGAAYALHPLSMLVVPFGAVLAVRQIVSYVRTGHAFGDPLPRWIEPLAAGFVVLLLCVWALRLCGLLGGSVSV